MGHGRGYDYPHAHPDGWVDQQYLPTEVAEQRYYRPTGRGYEAEVAERMQGWNARRGGADEHH
ncbi:MAG: hypothetical protein R2710_07500 [Acidimicrobiales bacterium]